MRDPYLFDDADALINLSGIRYNGLLRNAEHDIRNLAITVTYRSNYTHFNLKNIQDIHYTLFSQM